MRELSRAGRIAVTALCSAALSGCGYLQAQSRIDPQVVAAYSDRSNIQSRLNQKCPKRLEGDTRTGAINLDCFAWDDSGNTAYKLAVRSPEARNRLMDILMGRSNTLCNNDMARLVANEATVNASLSIATSALSAAATIVTGEQASNILSGLAGTANASRGHINAEVYRNTLSPVVVRAIRDERRKKEVEIEARRTDPLATYSADRMIRHVNDYHQLCSFHVGLQLVVKAVDRLAFDAADRRRMLGNDLEVVQAQLIRARAQLASATGAEKTNLETQIAALSAHETRLITERSALPTEGGAE